MKFYITKCDGVAGPWVTWDLGGNRQVECNYCYCRNLIDSNQITKMTIITFYSSNICMFFKKHVSGHMALCVLIK